MRKFIWLLLLVIVMFWIAVSKIWTGSEKPEDSYDFPSAAPVVTPEEPYPTAVIASSSATPSATPYTTPSPSASPTISVNLQY